MIYWFYRYPHPTQPLRWLYVGQGPKRHLAHSRGKSAFGFLYQQHFPDLDLSAPEYWFKECPTQHDADEEEAISMFQFRTWGEFDGGMNQQLPGRVNFDKVKKAGELRRRKMMDVCIGSGEGAK